MSIENCGELFPEGSYDLEVSGVPEKKERNGTIFWEFPFITELDGQPATYTEFLPIWLCGPMFKVLGFKEIRPKSYDVEPTLALGKRIRVILVHEEITSGNKKGQLVSRLKEMVAVQSYKATPVMSKPVDDTPAFLKPDKEIPFGEGNSQVPI